jgi:hypothetical protein
MSSNQKLNQMQNVWDVLVMKLQNHFKKNLLVKQTNNRKDGTTESYFIDLINLINPLQENL